MDLTSILPVASISSATITQIRTAANNSGGQAYPQKVQCHRAMSTQLVMGIREDFACSCSHRLDRYCSNEKLRPCRVPLPKLVARRCSAPPFRLAPPCLLCRVTSDHFEHLCVVVGGTGCPWPNHDSWGGRKAGQWLPAKGPDECASRGGHAGAVDGHVPFDCVERGEIIWYFDRNVGPFLLTK